MKREGTHQNMALLHYCCVRVWVVRCSLVGIPPRCAFVFQSGMEEPHQALSIIHLTCHHHNPPTERPQERAYKWKLLRCERCELEWKENHNRGVREREREDDRWWARMGWKERSGGRMDNKEAEGWQVIVAEEVTEMAGRRKDEQALIFYTVWFLYTWRDTSDCKLSCSPSSFCHWLYLVSAISRCGWQWKANFHMSQTQREAQWKQRANQQSWH